MSVQYGSDRLHFDGSNYKAAASVRDLRAGCYPTWIKVLFYGGIGLIAISFLSVFASIYLVNMPGLDVLFGGVLLGIIALYVVATVGPRYRTSR